MPSHSAVAIRGAYLLPINARALTSRFVAVGRQLGTLRNSAGARNSFRNALYGAAEYIALPLTMLVAAPFLLRRLGAPQFGLWMLAAAAVTSTNLISTGFGDAALKYASTYRGRSDRKRLE